MITKAIIRNRIDNKFLVNIPLFQSAGQTDEILLEATLCYEPGNLEAYSKGDVVFVAFEDGLAGKPVIIGKLYLGEEKNIMNHFFTACLDATVSAKLPGDTSIGDIKAEDVYSALRNDKVTQERLTEIEKDLRAILKYIQSQATSGEYFWVEDDEIEAMVKGEKVPERSYEPIPGSMTQGKEVASNQDIEDLYI